MTFFNPKNAKERIESLEFYDFLSNLSIFFITNYRGTKNSLILDFIEKFDRYREWETMLIRGYKQLLNDYSYWNSREFYRENMRKFAIGELSTSEFVWPVLEQLRTDHAEARDLVDDYYKQTKIELDPKSLDFSKIFRGLPAILETFEDDFLEDGEEKTIDIPEEDLRKGIESALVEIEKYFKD